jgi:N-acetylneuraminate synthase
MTPTLIIAEAGVNHNGSIDIARKLIDAAADAGADVVKFQSFSADSLATSGARRARYQIDNMKDDGSQAEMLRALEISEQDHRLLYDHCAKRGIAFLSTAFDFSSLNVLLSLNPKWIKIPSGDITFGPMLLRASQTRKRIILSTGMATIADIEDALAVIAYGLTFDAMPKNFGEIRAAFALPETANMLKQYVTILHCVTMYPCPPDVVNLSAMDTIRHRFGLPVGYSDHSLGIAIPIAAVARGAVVIEKHLTLARSMPGPDHAASLEPDEFAAMVKGIREVEHAIGNGDKNPTITELETRLVARRSLTAARQIRCGETIKFDDLEAKRPGSGISPMQAWDFVGRISSRDYALDDEVAE